MKRGGVPSFSLEPSATNNVDSPDDPGNLSDSQHLVERTFGSKWLKFVPPAQIARLRLKFNEIMVSTWRSVVVSLRWFMRWFGYDLVWFGLGWFWSSR